MGFCQDFVSVRRHSRLRTHSCTSRFREQLLPGESRCDETAGVLRPCSVKAEAGASAFLVSINSVLSPHLPQWASQFLGHINGPLPGQGPRHRAPEQQLKLRQCPKA